MPTEPLMQKVEWRRERIQKFIGKGHDVGSSTHAEALDMAKNSELLFAHRMNDLFAGKTKLFSQPYEAGLIEQAIERLKIADTSRCPISWRNSV